PLAAAAAQRQPLAPGALRWKAPAPGAEGAGKLRLRQLGQGLLSQLTHAELVQHEKVAGVDAAVALHHKILTAISGGGAGPRGLARQQADVVLKQAHADITACLPVVIPLVEYGIEKPAVPLGGEGEGMGAPRFLQRVQAGDELKKLAAQLFQA